MNILLTNDDGVNAEGINALYDVLSKKHNVFIIAPDEEKSGTSNAISFKENLEAVSVAENKYAISGFTADCVNLGLRGDIIPEVDLVISGINHGPNIGDDIYFSGTVGGARVAYIRGISGIAVSMNCKGTSRFFNDASGFMLKYIEKSDLFSGDKCRFLNINYPNLPESKILGIKYSSLGRRKYNDSYRVISRNNPKINLQYIRAEADYSRDIEELGRGYILITPLILDCTDYEFLNQIDNTDYKNYTLPR